MQMWVFPPPQAVLGTLGRDQALHSPAAMAFPLPAPLLTPAFP